MRTLKYPLVLFMILLVTHVLAGTHSKVREDFAPLLNPQRGVTITNDQNGTQTTTAAVTDPSYSYEALPNGTVRFNLQNNALAGISGDLIREGITYPQYGEIITTFNLPATGDTFTYIDDHVLPGKSYVYIFEYIVEGTSGYVINFDTVTVVSTIPALSNFYLIATAHDDEYEVLHDGYEIVIENTNIRAEANADLTGSVVFYLNGKQSRDNTSPFALFPEVNGDFKKGHLKNGTYTLMAIAYPENNGKGIPGDTLTVTFSVNNTYEDPKVSVYPNPLNANSTVMVNGNASDRVSIRISDGSGKGKTIHTGTLDDNGTLEYSLSSLDLKKGVYILSVDVNGRSIQKRLIVE